MLYYKRDGSIISILLSEIQEHLMTLLTNKSKSGPREKKHELSKL